MNYGLQLKPIESNNYIFGASPLSGMPDVLPSGDWRPYLPKYEPQFEGYETYGCTVWGGQNQTEIILKFLTGIEHNFDERFNYNICEINPPGADPQLYYESQRKQFLTEGKLLKTPTLAEFKTPRPMTDEYLNEARKFGYIVGHEWLWTNNPSKEVRLNLLRTGLKKCPVGISVSSWASDSNDLYINNGMQNNHWVVCVAIDGESPIIFDSYDQSIKKLHPDHQIQVAKLIYITKKEALTETQTQGFWSQIKAIWALVWGIKEQIDAINPVVESKPVEPVIPKRNLLKEFCIAISEYEGKPGDLNHKNKNPGNIRNVDGTFKKFKTWEEGMLALEDYVTRACTGRHASYKPDFTITQFFEVYAPKSDNNNPHTYASWVAGKLRILTTVKIKEFVS